MVRMHLCSPDFGTALDMLKKASDAKSSNPQAQFQRGVILSRLGRFEEALVQLQNVKDFTPREPSVHFQIGKVLVSLNRFHEAWRHFNSAYDLDPKNGTLYKSYVDKMPKKISHYLMLSHASYHRE